MLSVILTEMLVVVLVVVLVVLLHVLLLVLLFDDFELVVNFFLTGTCAGKDGSSCNGIWSGLFNILIFTFVVVDELDVDVDMIVLHGSLHEFLLPTLAATLARFQMSFFLEL